MFNLKLTVTSLTGYGTARGVCRGDAARPLDADTNIMPG